ncbi:hypothetical protein JCM16358_18320 [Halanaerocella petrolearia]
MTSEETIFTIITETGNAQDHLATATLTKDLVEDMIGRQKEINSLK